MRILFLTPQLPYPPRQGTSIRNFNLIANLAQRHTVDLLSFRAPGDADQPPGPLAALCGRIATRPQPNRSLRRRLRDTLLSPLPDMALRLEDAGMHTLVQQWLAEGAYDILQIEGIELAQYARHASGSRTAVVFDDHNCEYLLQRRNALNDLAAPRRWHAAGYSLAQWRKLAAYEAAVCRRAAVVTAVSAPDRAALQRIAPQASIEVVPNGINVEEYRPSPPAQQSPFMLLFTGKMDYRPNIDAALWFGTQVFPLVQAAAPDVRWQIVGMNPHARLDVLRANPAIEITGAVPDIRPYLGRANAYVIPMRVGGGTRFKALEAMAAARPIVSTTLGVEGIGVTHERELLLADQPRAFAEAILRLIDDAQQGRALAQRLGSAARAFVSQQYTWSTIIPHFDRIYDQIYDRLDDRTDPQLHPSL